MDRRSFLGRSAMAATAVALWGPLDLAAGAAGETWRTFEVTTDIEILKPEGVTRVWVPLPLAETRPYQRGAGAPTFTAPGGRARLVAQGPSGVRMIAAEWPEGTKPVLCVTARAETRDYATDPSASHARAPRDSAALARYMQPTSLLPITGIVKDTADQITAGAHTDVEKARAIYNWIVDNTYRDAAVRGCGIGDIRGMLETRNLGGKCADLNALFVGLARAAGLPARDVYGIRVAPSALGYKSLGTSSDVITKAQHCRAEVYLAGPGWTPVDPADVRKVMLEEPPGNLPPTADKVQAARSRLFGSWEMNWIAFNDAHDVALPGSARTKPLPFFMYPYAETATGALDSLDPDAFRYRIATREIGARNRR